MLTWIINFFKSLFAKTDEPFKFEPGMVGIDISHHNPVTDMSQVIEYAEFIYLKATEGKTFVSNTLKENVSKLKKLGYKSYGFYHYYRINRDPIEQAENFLRFYEGDLPPVLDIELKGNEDIKPEDLEGILQFLEYLEERTGTLPIVYTNFFFCKDYLRPDYRLSKYPLWIAWYTKDYSRVKIPYPWKKPLIWQYSSYGKVDGIEGNVDKNQIMSEEEA